MTPLCLDGKNYLREKAKYAVLRHATAKCLPRYIMQTLLECLASVILNQLQQSLDPPNRMAGNFVVAQIFAFFEGRAVNAKIKTGRNSHAPVIHMQSLW